MEPRAPRTLTSTTMGLDSTVNDTERHVGCNHLDHCDIVLGSLVTHSVHPGTQDTHARANPWVIKHVWGKQARELLVSSLERQETGLFDFNAREGDVLHDGPLLGQQLTERRSGSNPGHHELQTTLSHALIPSPPSHVSGGWYAQRVVCACASGREHSPMVLMQWWILPGPRRPWAISKPRPSPSRMLLAGTRTFYLVEHARHPPTHPPGTRGK